MKKQLIVMFALVAFAFSANCKPRNNHQTNDQAKLYEDSSACQQWKKGDEKCEKVVVRDSNTGDLVTMYILYSMLNRGGFMYNGYHYTGINDFQTSHRHRSDGLPITQMRKRGYFSNTKPTFRNSTNTYSNKSNTYSNKSSTSNKPNSSFTKNKPSYSKSSPTPRIRTSPSYSRPSGGFRSRSFK